jgi:outer membrane protein assembly factor BamB
VRHLAAVMLLVSTAAAARAAPGDWPMARHDAQNTAATSLELAPGQRPRAWTFGGSGRVWGYQPGITVWSSPAVGLAEGRPIVVVGSYDHTVYCLDAATGELRWRFTTGGPVYSTPAIWHDGTRTLVIVASSDRLVYAVDAATGRQQWVHSAMEFRATLGGAHLAAPAVGTAAGEDAVFVAHWVWDSSIGHNLQAGALTALRARDGKPLWTRPLGDNRMADPVFARIGDRGLVLAGSSDGRLHALEADTGRVLWTRTELDAIRSGPAVVSGPTGPVCVLSSKYGVVRAVDALSGVERWSFKTGDRVTGSPAIVTRGGAVVVVVGSYDRALYALDVATGRMLWRYTARGGIYSSPALAPMGDAPLVLASAWDHTMHAVRLGEGTGVFRAFTGRPLWDVAGLDESNWSSPAVARLGDRFMAYLGSYDGTLRALPLDEASRAPQAARSNGWFWLSFPIVLVPVAALTLWLTRRHRQRVRSRR